ncbi:MAG: metallophosphoesterase [Thermoplasmata archaeon]
MEDAILRPVPDEPLLELVAPGEAERWLLLADVHLGLHPSDGRGSSSGEAHAIDLAEHLVTVARRSASDGLLIAGDVKHPIVGVPPALRPIVFGFFSTLLEAGLRVVVVPGNHDVGLARHLPREVEVVGASGHVLHRVGIFHGHRWPSNAVLRAPTLVAGHLHPGVRLAPTGELARSKPPCWVRVEFPPFRPPARRRRRHAPIHARELILLPAYNPLCGTEALNRERPARGRTFLFRRFVMTGTPRAYLLDGTDLGRIVTPRPTERPSRARERASTDR